MTTTKPKTVAPVVIKRKAATAPLVTKVVAKKSATEKSSVKATAKNANKKAAPAKKIKKDAKPKVVRDSFTMPQSEYQKIADIKALCAKAAMPVKKSEVLRAGLLMLSLLELTELKTVLGKLAKIATGRPKKD